MTNVCTPNREDRNRADRVGPGAHPALAATGIRSVPVEHKGCSQKSEEEGQVIGRSSSLLTQRYSDRDGKEHSIGLENILVVTPYNVQVNYLKSILPSGARVGTVDKFQGQEAEVVLTSRW